MARAKKKPTPIPVTKRFIPDLPPVPEPPPRKGHNGVRVFTLAETAAQEHTIEQLLLSLASDSHITAICRERHGIGRYRVARLIERTRERWTREDEIRRPAAKAEAVRRLSRWIILAGGQQDTNGRWITPPNHGALVRYESLLADIQGTREPIKVDVDVRVSQTCLNVIAGLTPVQVQSLLAKYQETSMLAESYRAAQLPPKTNGIAKAS